MSPSRAPAGPPEVAALSSVSSGPASGPALETVGITVRYGDFTALSDVSIRVEYGSVHALIGPNGAGKTTLAGAISGDLELEAGHVFVAGAEATRMPTWKRARLGLGRSYQVAHVFDSLSILDNLRVAGRSGQPSRIQAALDLVQLDHLPSSRADALSAGDRKRLEIAMLVVQGAKILVLDEPTAGMSALETDLTRNLLASLAESGVGVLLIEHDLDLVFRLAHVIDVLNLGRTIFHGTAEEVVRNPFVRDVYLHSSYDESLVAQHPAVARGQE